MAVSGGSRTRARLVRAELSFAGGSARGPNRTVVSLVLGGALLCFANFESGLGVKNWAYRLSGAASCRKRLVFFGRTPGAPPRDPGRNVCDL